ncbi:tail fiber protein [Cesiribacter andamanensis]|uniref:Phage Tail Collar Domain protein n=1 Tax=Cesiribacter andamanensis AMV16 TaxID=1279009 RepID=M7N0V4_9BACT|nr:tail fiber protein [Cesiribacter andamanensis]EMR02293.1 Phage Tail Collar Domain protein [Cesiribacter andamanensis AMV16]
MKTKSLFLICSFLLFSLHLLAQSTPGIAVQGIARNAEKAALVDELLTFTFEIQDAATATLQYKEEVQMRTDPYGVFSHIVGTGTKLSGGVNFNEVPFHQQHMKLVISVNYRGNTIVLSNAPFQYAPYAKSADNGVPTGTIMAFVGAASSVPAGWVLCDGRDISSLAGSQALRSLLGANAVPNLQGMFLRGTGTSPVNNQAGPSLRGTQADGLKSHDHAKGSLAVDHGGSHSHGMTFNTEKSASDGDGGSDHRLNRQSGDGTHSMSTHTDGAHSHTISGTTAATGIAETRPVSYGINYIIKL